MRGEIDLAWAALDEVTPLPQAQPIRARVFRGLAEAWIDCEDGTPFSGAEKAVRIGREAIDKTHVVWGAFACHAAVRFGHPEQAIVAFDGVDDASGPLVAMFGRHARAAANRNVLALEKVAGEFESIGAFALAADAWAAAALGNPNGGMVAAVRSRELARACPGYAPPLHRELPEPISKRQLEIARWGAAGLSTKDIADRLYITAKTVDNHLLRIYRELGISGREELVTAIPPSSIPDPDPGLPTLTAEAR